VVPVQPSPLDLWATTETLKMAHDEQRRSLGVLNRVPPRSGLTDEIVAQLGRIGPPIAATRIGNRVALARAMALGLGVVETADLRSDEHIIGDVHIRTFSAGEIVSAKKM
jgi:chromosome partitioning protein